MSMKVRFFAGLFFFAFALVVTAQGPPHPPAGPCCWPPIPTAETLVNWWSFDEPSSSTSADVGGAVNDVGTDHGAIVRTSRNVQFQGAQWIEVADGNEVDFNGDCPTNDAEAGTIAFWVKTTMGSGVVTILDKREAPTANFLRGYSVYLWNGRIGFQMATGAGNLSCGSAGSACNNYIATTLPSVADGNWHSVALSFSRCTGGTGLFYVDGVTVPFTPRNGDLTTANNLFIGRQTPALGSGYFTGQLDDLMYVKYAYSKTQLDALFGSRCNMKCYLP
jgi:Concanavalin A-like lectin/glucanases superfamily